jgi:hypothetical protein
MRRSKARINSSMSAGTGFLTEDRAVSKVDLV